jgi:DNA-binding NarL/FixJ family response regulator
MLTTREVEILQATLDYDGDLFKVADELFISQQTVRNHLHKNIYKKLMVSSLIGALRVGLLQDWISLEASLNKNPPCLLKDTG